MLSDFQFTNPLLVKFSFEVHDKFLLEHPGEHGEINAPITLQTNIAKEKEGGPRALVTQNCDIGKQNDEYPYFISASIRAAFIWNESISPDMVTQLLKHNAPALLLSYLRPIVMYNTAASGIKAVNIPYLDFTKMQESQEQQEASDTDKK